MGVQEPSFFEGKYPPRKLTAGGPQNDGLEKPSRLRPSGGEWCRPGGPGANGAMLHGGTSVMTQVHEYLKQYSQLDYTCDCNTLVHAFHLGVTSLIKQESGCVCGLIPTYYLL